MKIIVVLIIGVALFLLLKVLGLFKNYLVRKYSKWVRKFNVLPAIELITWLLYVFWANDFLFKEKSYYQYLVASLVIILVAFFAWFLVRDFIAGIIFRVQNDLPANKNIQLGSINGKIKSKHLTHLIVETTDNQMVKIPYSKLQQEVVSELSDSQGADEYKIMLTVKKNVTKAQIEEKIRILILNNPWSNFRKKPMIKLLSEDDTNYSFEIKVNTMEHKHMRLLEKSIIDQLLETD
ncbi:MAG: mechanosensitive ion channel [Bacteroidales bacterium]